MQIDSIVPWKDQVAPMAWVGDRIYYHKTGSNVVSEGFSSLPDGSDERLETGSPLYPLHTHQSVEDVSCDGKLGLVTVERSNHWPNPDGWLQAAPGMGTYNDLWLQKLDTGETWKIVDLVQTGSACLIWPRFNPSGTKVMWTECWSVSWFGLGSWVLKIADISWVNSKPVLKNLLTFKDSQFIEVYGTTDNDTNILACKTATGISGANSQIVKFPLTASKIGTPVRLSPKTPNEVWAPNENWTEFAYVMPAYPDRIMFGRSYQSKGNSIEFWTMKKDGTDVQRLTWFSDPANSQYQGHSTVYLGGIGWNPENPKQFVVGIGLDTQNNYISRLVTIT